MSRFNWQLFAACRGSTDLMYVSLGSVAGARPWSTTNEVRIAKAKQICAECPVLHACRNEALEGPHDRYAESVMGGLDPRERDEIRRRRRKAAATVQPTNGTVDEQLRLALFDVASILIGDVA